MLELSKTFPLGPSGLLNINISRPASQLGINLGEAHVIRNAGGSAYVFKATQNTLKFDFL